MNTLEAMSLWHLITPASGIGLIVLLLVLAGLSLRRPRGHKRRFRFRRGLRRKHRDPEQPAHLAKLVMAERDVFTDYPVPLAGRPDEIHRSKDKLLVPVDTKTRRRPAVYLSDVIQLSTYAVLLAHGSYSRTPRRLLRKRRVAGYGYVRCVTPAGTRWRRTELLTEAEIVQLYNRRIALEQGRIAPRPARKAVFCRHCEFRNTCPDRLG